MSEEQAGGFFDDVAQRAKRAWGETGLSTEAVKAFEELKARWAKLEAWGIRSRAPEIAAARKHVVAESEIEAWDRFRAAWEGGDPDPSNLGSMSADLQRVEDFARAHGFEEPPKPQVKVPDIEQATAANAAAAAVDKAAKVVTDVVKDAADDAGKAAGSWWERIPWEAKALAGLALGAWIAGSLRAVAVEASVLAQAARARLGERGNP